MDRRRFVTYVVALPLSVAVPGCRRRSSRPRRSADARAEPPAGVLNPLQRRTLEAACARIIPTDQDPGAKEANAAAYIDAQLAHPPVSGFSRLIAAGLKRLQFVAQRVHRASFADLAADKQDAVLRLVQRGRRMAGRFSGQQFLHILVVLTLEGFLGDPVYGGNRDRVGWKLIQFTPQSPGPARPYRVRES